MSSKNNNEVISIAKPHTIKKFELISSYVKAWAQKVLNGTKCKNLVFIDCMCNSGEYVTENGEKIVGTAVRVSHILRDVAFQYPDRNIYLLFNDYNSDKIEHLKSILSGSVKKFKVSFYKKDANEFLKWVAPSLKRLKAAHTLLVYDPYDASINWDAVIPYINTWSEVIINHMVSDPVRSVRVVKKESAIGKLEMTYQCNIADLIPYGSDRYAYERRIEEIIQTLHRNKSRQYYIAAYPFFIRTNVVEYNLIHCTGHIEGFKLYKDTAWKTFGSRSSMKNTHGAENQMQFDFEGSGLETTIQDQDCYTLQNIAEYLLKSFIGRKNVPLKELWGFLDNHPVFPSGHERNEIKRILKEIYGATSVGKSYINFPDRR